MYSFYRGEFWGTLSQYTSPKESYLTLSLSQLTMVGSYILKYFSVIFLKVVAYINMWAVDRVKTYLVIKPI